VNRVNRYIGIDLGTSSVKLLLLSENGIDKTVSRDYKVSYPAPNYSEQNPDDWYDQTVCALDELLEDTDRTSIKAISFSGQMHGLVMLDECKNVIRPAILWNDGRAVREVDYLNNEIGRDFLLKHTGNIAFAGFTAPKLLWVKNNEPENFSKISKIMLPKDYLAYRLSGEFATDVSDASGTLYFDVSNRKWSDEMLEIIGIDKTKLPVVRESCEVIGNIRRELANKFGLNDDVKIVIGGGDNACSAIGTGIVNDGECNISLGTSGTIFVETNNHNYDKNSAIHAFCSASGKYHYLACILSAASCQKWWVENILNSDYDISGMEQYLGKNDVIFLPYLMGERSPINDPNAKAIFYGMTLSTTREQMSLAILEGVAMALRQNIEIIRLLGVNITKSKICGGGARNRLWLKIIASALDIVLEIPELEQGGALGAALLAMNRPEIAKQFYRVREIIKPDKALAEYYDKKYRNFKNIQNKII